MLSTLRSPILRALLFYGVTGLLLVSSGGCRTGRDNQIDLLERELRSQEDYIYELEDYVVEYSEKLRECRCTQPNGRVVHSGPKKSKSSTNHRADRPTPEDEEAYEEDANALPSPDEPEVAEPLEEEQDLPEDIIPEEMEIPDLDISDPVGQNESGDPFPEVVLAVYEEASESLEEESQTVVIPDPVDYAEQTSHEELSDEQFNDELFSEVKQIELVQIETEAVERVLEQLVITQLFRGAGELAKPTSLLTVIEARDTYDEPIDVEGEVSLMVMTGDQDDPKRLHRWDFTGEETSAAWQSSELGDGLHLELPLEGTKLPGEEIELWVRLVTRDGRKFLTQTSFRSETLLAYEELSISEETLPGATPLSGDSVLAETAVEEDSIPLVAQVESSVNVLRPSSEKPQKDKPRWRASMQRTHAMEGSFSTTSKTQRWTSQPPGGRIAQRPATTTKPANTRQSRSNHGRSSSSASEERRSHESANSSTSKSSPQWQPYR